MDEDAFFIWSFCMFPLVGLSQPFSPSGLFIFPWHKNFVLEFPHCQLLIPRKGKNSFTVSPCAVLLPCPSYPRVKKKVTLLVREGNASRDRFSFWSSDAAFNRETGIFGVWTRVWNKVQLKELTIRGFRNDKYSPLNRRINPESHKSPTRLNDFGRTAERVVSLSSQHISW